MQTMVQHILSSDLQTTAVKAKFDAFETTVDNLLCNCEVAVNEPNVFYLDDDDVIDICGNNNMTTLTARTEYGDMIQPDKIDTNDERFDEYLNAEIIIDHSCNGENGSMANTMILKIQSYTTKRSFRITGDWLHP